MKRSLKGKVILSYLAVALITVLVVSALIRLTFGQSLMNLVVEQQTALLKENVQTYFTSNGSLDGFFDFYLQLSHQNSGPTPPNFGSGPQDSGPAQPAAPDRRSKPREIRGVYGLVDTNYQALIPTAGIEIGQIMPAEKIQQAIPVDVDGVTVAWILQDSGSQLQLSSEEELFLQRTTLVIGFAALAGVLVAVGMGYLLAGRLLNPIRRLTEASQSLARGNLQQQVPVTSQDELGQLTTTFNQMSADLLLADQQRKRMTADITHDLSTPLQVISGYIEMLEMGDLTLSPKRIEIIKTEIGHLRRLVGDLGTLTQVEGNGLDIQLQPVQPGVLLERIFHSYQPIAARQGVNLVLDMPASIPSILVDEGRMLQVLKNLVDNALRFTPDGGTIRLRAAAVGAQVQVCVNDSGSGIDPEDLPYVFDRFYQADKARGGNSGKMGLGLAICKALVAAQGGVIAAASAGKGQGTNMIVTFDPVK